MGTRPILCRFLLVSVLAVADTAVAAEWPSGVTRIAFTSSADGTEQPAMFHAPAASGPRPLLVALHTWSSDWRQPESIEYANDAIARGWVFVHPDFRGPNVQPEATGSELAVADVLDSVEYAKRHADVDRNRIYLVGYSGGAHLALLLAGRAPHLWAGVSAWNPIVDLGAWHDETAASDPTYASQIVASCGGVPARGTAAGRECRQRSPITWLSNATAVPIDVNAGIGDGHTGPVPVSHSFRAFEALAAKRDRFSRDEIESVVERTTVPAHLRPSDPLPPYGDRAILLRRQSRNVRLTIFDGGHEKDAAAALEWLARQARNDAQRRR